jgi:prephenate dehydratase
VLQSNSLAKNFILLKNAEMKTICLIFLSTILISASKAPKREMFEIKSEFLSETKAPIYTNASAGNFSHRAINALLKKETLLDESVFFYAQLEDALRHASLTNGYAFIKLYEDPDQVVDLESALGLREYKIIKMVSVIRMKNALHLFQHKKALAKKISLKKVASSPDLLRKTANFIGKGKYLQIEVPGGSDEAAKLLVSKEFDLSTGIIGCPLLCEVFSDLSIVEKNVQDYSNNYEVYALIQVKKREQKVDIESTEQEIISTTKEFQNKLSHQNDGNQVLILSDEFPLLKKPSS